MKNKTRVINIDGFHIEFQRYDTRTVSATIIGETPKKNRVKVKVKFNFYCLPYYMRALKSEWLEARKHRMSEIESIDRTFPAQ
jgi:hypothetical protein